MSKASEYAAYLKHAKEMCTKFCAVCGGREFYANVTATGDCAIEVYSIAAGQINEVLDVNTALALAAWIRDTFGEPEQVSADTSDTPPWEGDVWVSSAGRIMQEGIVVSSESPGQWRRIRVREVRDDRKEK